MFRRRRSDVMKRALLRSQDPELAELYEQLAERRERIAALELELFDTRSALAVFQSEVARRLGPLQTRLEAVEKELRQARRQAERRAQWGERAESGDIPYDVIEQFERTWRRCPPAAETPKKKPLDVDARTEIKQLYRALAKRFHPDLTVDPAEKKYREGVMAQVNEAYAADNLEALRRLAELPDRPEIEPERTRQQVMVDLRAEIKRLDQVAWQLQATIDQLTRSHDLQLMLEATMARQEGRDLIAELTADLRRQVAQLEAELAALG
jgi:hypothetical protein